MYSFIKHNGLLINKDYIGLLEKNNLSDLDSLMKFKGGIPVKEKKSRSVVRIDLEEGIITRTFYLKQHFRPGKEMIKSILPWSKKEDARNEWENMLLLDSLGFCTMIPVVFGSRERFGIPYYSLTLSESIYDTEKLETYLPGRFSPPLSREKVIEKRSLINKLATLARDFHNKGLNHQDFYLGHLLIRQADEKIFIVDLQRIHRSRTISTRDRIKDLAQLCYSAGRLGILSRTDFIRFAHSYFGKDNLNGYEKGLIKKIIAKAKRIARHDAKLLRRRKNSS